MSKEAINLAQKWQQTDWNTESPMSADFAVSEANDVISALMDALRQALEQPAQQEPTAASIYEAIKHGDARHRQWLRQALENIFAGQPVPHEAAPQPAPVQHALTKEMVDAAERIDWSDSDVRGNIVNMWQAMCAVAPQTAQRKPLTDAQINAFFEGMEPNNGFWLSFARAVEAAHGIKENT